MTEPGADFVWNNNTFQRKMWTKLELFDLWFKTFLGGRPVVSLYLSVLLFLMLRMKYGCHDQL